MPGGRGCNSAGDKDGEVGWTSQSSRPPRGICWTTTRLPRTSACTGGVDISLAVCTNITMRGQIARN